MSYSANFNYLPPDVREVLLARRRTLVERLRAMSNERRLLMFEGCWRTPQDVQSDYRTLRRRSWLMFVEILVLLVIFLCGGIAAIALLALVLGL